MRTRFILLAATSIPLLGWFAASGQFAERKQPETPDMSVCRDALANLPFPNNQPTAGVASALRDEKLYQRATQVYLWSLPAVNMQSMKEASERTFGAGYNVFPVWKQRLNAKTIVTTPNSDVIYAMTYLNVGRDGPMVIEIPPQQQGILDDFWQRPIAGPTIAGKFYAGDVGLAGPDKGQGGKFLILPPNYQGRELPGYYVYRSRTNNVFVFWRAFFSNPNDLGPPNRLIAQTRIYPAGRPAQAKAMKFPDASGVPLNMVFPFDSTYFDVLSRFVNSEVEDPSDTDWRGMLAEVGIVKNRQFQPDAHTRSILNAAAQTAFKMARSYVYEDLATQPGGLIYSDRHFVDLTRNNTVDYEWMNRDGRFRDIDLRAAVYSIAYSTSPAMISTTPGQGARYLPAFKDANGQFLVGNNSYVLHLPPNVPAAMFWSVTLYDSLTASGLDNGQPFPSIGARDNPIANADGSTDLYFGPNAPSGKESNWRRTVPGKGFFVMLRLYGPTEAYYNKTWKPGDMTRAN
jgi:hypothetical protein